MSANLQLPPGGRRPPGRMVYFVNGNMVEADPAEPMRQPQQWDFSNIMMAALTAMLFSFTAVLYRRAGVVALGLLAIGGGSLIALYMLDLNRPEGTPGYLMRGLTHLAVYITKFWIWPGRTALLVGLVASLFFYFIAPRFTAFQLCGDTSGGVADSFGYSCDFYASNLGLQCDGRRDTDDFKVGQMCCICGGGEMYHVRHILAVLLILGGTVAWIYQGMKNATHGNGEGDLEQEQRTQELVVVDAQEQVAPPFAAPASGAMVSGVAGAAPVGQARQVRVANVGAGQLGGGIAPAEGSTANCVICLSNPSDHALLPCGHLCICEACLPQLAREWNRCPLCRNETQGAARIFIG